MSSSLPLIAMIDDDTAVVQLVTTFLEAHGYRMVSCHQSAQALALIHSEQPDLVLLDIQMDEWNAGLQILAALRQDASTRSLPVIVCSANLPLLRRQEQSNRDLGATAVAKPYTFDALLAAIATALGQAPAPTDE
jgi:CheY-like chemotaxis protein